MTTEIAISKQKKEIEALIQTVSVTDPSMKDKLNTAVIWNYLQMPDNSFGWTTSAVMPTNIKLMAIAAHIQAGAKPGYGHIYFLGNKLYQSADFVRQTANSNPEWKITGNPKFAPHSQDEKDMYGLQDGDMSCKSIMSVNFKGQIMTIEGDGIIGKEELSYRSQKGHPKPGLNGRKNIAMTLKTRAMRDMYSRFYPANGTPIGPDRSEEAEVIEAGFEDQIDLAKTESTPENREETREAIKIDDNKKNDAEDRKKFTKLLNEVLATAKEKGIKQKDVWLQADCKTKKELTEKPTDELFDCLEVITDFIESYEEAEKKDESSVNHLELAKERFSKQVDMVKEKGGKPMTILGFNHLNLFQSKDMNHISEASDKLVEWLKNPVVEEKTVISKREKPLPVTEQQEQADIPDDLFDEVPVKSSTRSGPRPKPANAIEAYQIIHRLQGHEKLTDKKTKDKLSELNNRYLLEGDEHLIVKASRTSNTGNYSEINELLENREIL